MTALSLKINLSCFSPDLSSINIFHLKPPPPLSPKMDLDRHLRYDGVDYECTICERLFASLRAIYDHCRNTSRHEWCETCERVFLSEPAKQQHLRNSRNHNICWICPQIRDFDDSSDLDDHLVERHHYCDVCDLAHSSSRKLQEHDVTVHYLCVICDRFLGNENNLRMVARSLGLRRPC